uniref:Capsid protein VP1 n=1 Tax=Lygus hesperus TaxID=30085 RepID=A0A0A9VST1_LYGHE
MPVLPFHRYIGPGNPIESGPCVDEDDCIAKKHDIAYESAQTPRDVRLADVEAIQEFRANWLAGNWHSFIGDVGLSLKYAVETYTGVLYPKLPDVPPCEILSLFNDFLRLHCVHKVRLFNRLPFHTSHTCDLCNTHDLCNTQDLCKTHDFTKPNLSHEIYFYVLVAWYLLYHKNQQPRIINTSPTNSTNTKKPKVFKQNVHLLKNCDIFHVQAWIRLFALFQPTKVQQSDDYNDEEFSNMFMQYD